ncbi:MAG TPA: rhomboid family intramembrane serine protease [Flavobacteriales bacterium]
MRQLGAAKNHGLKIAQRATMLPGSPTSVSAPVDHGRRRLVTAAIAPLMAVGLMWTVFVLDRMLDLDLFRFGVLPRTVKGLFGILASPFIHGGWEHLINNSAPVLVLGWLLVYFYPQAAWRVLVVTWAACGFWVWVAARDSYHIGASGVIYGLAAFLFFSGVVRRQVALMTVSLIIVFLYGSMWWGVLPLVPGISWESHLFGGVAGAVMAWFYRKVPPAHVPPPIVLEDDPDDDVPEDDEQQDPPAGLGPSNPEWSSTDPVPGPFLYDPRRTSGTW